MDPKKRTEAKNMLKHPFFGKVPSLQPCQITKIEYPGYKLNLGKQKMWTIKLRSKYAQYIHANFPKHFTELYKFFIDNFSEPPSQELLQEGLLMVIDLMDRFMSAETSQRKEDVYIYLDAMMHMMASIILGLEIDPGEKINLAVFEILQTVEYHIFRPTIKHLFPKATTNQLVKCFMDNPVPLEIV
jgi:hypothetical protein